MKAYRKKSKRAQKKAPKAAETPAIPPRPDKPTTENVLEGAYGYLDEAHRNVAKTLFAAQELEQLLPWLRELHERGEQGAGMQHDFLNDQIERVKTGGIAALADLLGLFEDTRELGNRAGAYGVQS